MPDPHHPQYRSAPRNVGWRTILAALGAAAALLACLWVVDHWPAGAAALALLGLSGVGLGRLTR